VHLVGVGGIHMSAIARLLRHRRHEVSGSDLHLSALTSEVQRLGVTVHEGHAAENIDDAGLVVYTSAAQADNPELAEAKRRGIPVMKRGEMVALLQEGKQVIAVAGAHGKTTTSSLIAYMLQFAGKEPTFMIGGVLRDLGTNAAAGDGPHFVVEADEYDRAFLNYHPFLAVVTNIEPDHLDIYGSFGELQRAYAQFLSQVEDNGYIIACTDSPPVRAYLQSVGDGAPKWRAVSYSTTGEADWTADEIVSKGVDTLSFVVKCQKHFWGEVETKLPGVHNVANCLAAIAAGDILGLSRSEITGAIATFTGAERRFEVVGEAGGVTVIDSYAHHPSEIRADLAAARARYRGRRIVALFQPHTYTRTSYLLDEFRTAFGDADRLLVADTYAAREDPSAGMDARALTEQIDHRDVTYAGSVDAGARLVAAELRSGDVFLTVGAGDVNDAGPVVLEALLERGGEDG
jgi:UDP-N-acetylmuramate--alanine ligase